MTEVLRWRAVLGRFDIDFVSVHEGAWWDHDAIEIHLCTGGTTHPFIVPQCLTDGAYAPKTGLYRTPGSQLRFYYASDNVQRPSYQELSPEDVLDISVMHQLHWHRATQRGVVLHLIGTLSEFGTLGMVCIDERSPKARAMYDETVQMLHKEAQRA